MRVLLEKDISRIGRAGDIRNVAPGYFRNFLMPQKLAVIATPAHIKRAELMQKLHMENDEKQMEDYKKIIEKLNTEEFTIAEKINKEGHLFGSVTEDDILRILHEKGYTIIEKRHIQLDEHIKTGGKHEVSVTFASTITGIIHLMIIDPNRLD